MNGCEITNYNPQKTYSEICPVCNGKLNKITIDQITFQEYIFFCKCGYKYVDDNNYA